GGASSAVIRTYLAPFGQRRALGLTGGTCAGRWLFGPLPFATDLGQDRDLSRRGAVALDHQCARPKRYASMGQEGHGSAGVVRSQGELERTNRRPSCPPRPLRRSGRRGAAEERGQDAHPEKPLADTRGAAPAIDGTPALCRGAPARRARGETATMTDFAAPGV